MAVITEQRVMEAGQRSCALGVLLKNSSPCQRVGVVGHVHRERVIQRAQALRVMVVEGTLWTARSAFTTRKAADAARFLARFDKPGVRLQSVWVGHDCAGAQHGLVG
jgi:hypothetical protein